MWSYATLNRNISTQYYERMLLSQQSESVKAEMKTLTKEFDNDKLEFIKNPMVTEFLGISPYKSYLESELEKAVLSKLEDFLLELGKGFSFVERQKLVRTEKKDYFIDLVFYNFKLKAVREEPKECGVRHSRMRPIKRAKDLMRAMAVS